MFKNYLVSICFVWFFAALNLANASELVDNPLISAYQGAVIDGGSKKSSIQYKVALSPMIDGQLSDVETLRGELDHLQYEIPESESIEVVYESYLTAMKKSGFAIRFSCHKKECNGDLVTALFGSSGRKFDYSRVQDDVLNDENTEFYYLVGSRHINDQEHVVVVILRQIVSSSWPVYITQDVLKVADLKTKNIALNVDYQNEVQRNGKVVLKGLFFDTNKDTLKPKSTQALNQIANYLNNNSEQKFYVVGHTDMTGSYDSNVDLSKRRANSVVKQLTTEHGVNSKQIIPIGVGPVSPVASNNNASDQSLNRRVELVLR